LRKKRKPISEGEVTEEAPFLRPRRKAELGKERKILCRGGKRFLLFWRERLADNKGNQKKSKKIYNNGNKRKRNAY